MATLISVPVTLREDEIPSKQSLRDIIATFLTKEWPSVDPESLGISYHPSFANAHCPVERPKPTTGVPAEPLKVFIKFHRSTVSGLEIFKSLVPTKQEEAILCHEYGQSGLGAKVFGFFQTQDGTLGRIDEFLDARNMEPEDVEDPSIRADVASAMAQFHVLQASMEKKTVGEYYDAVFNGLRTYHRMEKLKRLGIEGGVNMDALVDYDFASRLRKVVRRLEQIGGKTGWCIHDVQFMNTMIKNKPEEGSKVVLIDFEFVMQNYRAFDIGGHFMQKMFKWFDEESKIANCRKYVYAMQWNRLTGDSDTGEQVFLESEYGYMLAITFDIHNMLCFMDDENDKDPLNLFGLCKLFDEFTSQYIKLGLEGV
ncbi:unnamed protein product [Penicillium bialowiezense]